MSGLVLRLLQRTTTSATAPLSKALTRSLEACLANQAPQSSRVQTLASPRPPPPAFSTEYWDDWGQLHIRFKEPDITPGATVTTEPAAPRVTVDVRNARKRSGAFGVPPAPYAWQPGKDPVGQYATVRLDWSDGIQYEPRRDFSQRRPARLGGRQLPGGSSQEAGAAAPGAGRDMQPEQKEDQLGPPPLDLCDGSIAAAEEVPPPTDPALDQIDTVDDHSWAWHILDEPDEKEPIPPAGFIPGKPPLGYIQPIEGHDNRYSPGGPTDDVESVIMWVDEASLEWTDPNVAARKLPKAPLVAGDLDWDEVKRSAADYEWRVRHVDALLLPLWRHKTTLKVYGLDSDGVLL